MICETYMLDKETWTTYISTKIVEIESSLRDCSNHCQLYHLLPAVSCFLNLSSSIQELSHSLVLPHNLPVHHNPNLLHPCSQSHLSFKFLLFFWFLRVIIWIFKIMLSKSNSSSQYFAQLFFAGILHVLQLVIIPYTIHPPGGYPLLDILKTRFAFRT